MSEHDTEHMDELPRLRDQCGALALELERETDPTRRAELARVRIPLMADSDSIPIADSVPGDGGHVARVS